MADIRRIKVNGNIYNLIAGDSRIFFGECDTAAATQAKTVAISSMTDALRENDVFVIKFVNGQTYSGVPTLNVNDLGAKNIRRLSSTNAARYEWMAGEYLLMIYDGTYFVLIDGGLASTTYYGLTKLSSAIDSTSEALAATPKAVKAAYDLAESKQDYVGLSVVNGKLCITYDDGT